MGDPTRDVARAVEVLRAGGLVAFPTETVYGLGADATDRAAVRRLYAVKGRPPGHPVIAHLGDPAELSRWAEPTSIASALAEAFWPGPLTVLVARRPGGIVDEVTGGRPSVGVRVPGHPLALEWLGACGRPVAAPSANRFGRVSPTSAVHVRVDLGDEVDVVLDGGPCAVGVESTIVDCTVDPPLVRREGAVTREELRAVVGSDLTVAETRGSAPGTLEVHYAPRARVVVTTRGALAATAERLRADGARVAVLGLAIEAPEGTIDLTVDGDVADYARALYARLREADRLSVDRILAVPPPEQGVGVAVADRLRRAAGAA